MGKKRNGETRKYMQVLKGSKNVSLRQRFNFQWTIMRNVSSKKRQTIYSESAELVTVCVAV